MQLQETGCPDCLTQLSWDQEAALGLLIGTSWVQGCGLASLHLEQWSSTSLDSRKPLENASIYSFFNYRTELSDTPTCYTSYTMGNAW